MKPKFDKSKFFLKSLSNILAAMIWSKKPSHATVPLKSEEEVPPEFADRLLCETLGEVDDVRDL
jgi:hypothetical protein